MRIQNFLTLVFCCCNLLLLSASENFVSNNSGNNFSTAMMVGDTTIFDTLALDIGQIKNRCLDTSMLTGAIDTIYNACADNASTTVSFVINEDTKCIKYEGRGCGTDTACVIICDVNGVCETQTLIVTATEPNCIPTKSYIFDTLFIGMSNDVCMDLSELHGSAISISNECPGSSGVSAIFTTFEDNGAFCVNYSTIQEGIDTACIVVTDDRGFMDTTCVIVVTKITKTDMICDTIPLGTDRVYQLVNTELPGNIVDFQNVCPQSADTSVIFGINGVTLEVEAITIGLGTDSACIIMCNEDDVCDTTLLKIVVIEDTTGVDPPIAVNDSLQIVQDSPVDINIIRNDTIPGTKVLAEIITPPANGMASLDTTDCSVMYLPDADFCGIDSFEYRICNEVGCDTAWVIIGIICNPPLELCIFNGFSPDGNTINDTWVIKGIENYPNNKVRVINRWGNEVFEMDGYRGTWDGTWNDMKLPDGTYFYVLDLNGDQSDVRSGYLQIHR